MTKRTASFAGLYNASVSKRTRGSAAVFARTIDDIITKYEDPDFIPGQAERQQDSRLMWDWLFSYGNDRPYRGRFADVLAKRLQCLAGGIRINGKLILKISARHGVIDFEPARMRESEMMMADSVLTNEGIWAQLAVLRERKAPGIVIQALHPRLGKDSSIRRAYLHDLFANDVMRVVFSMLE